MDRLHPNVRRTVVWTLALVVALGVFALPAAADTMEAFKADLAALKSAKEKDVDAIARLAKRGAKLYGNSEDEKERKFLVDAVGGKVSAISADEIVTRAVLEAIGKMGDPNGARYVRKHLKMKNKKDASEVLKLAIKTAGKVPHKSLAGPLISLWKRSASINIKRLSATAMCNYGQIKGHRSKILDMLLTNVRQVKPGQSGRMAQGNMGEFLRQRRGETSPIWTSMSPILTGLLNKLTGQDVRTLDNWFGIYDANKRNLDALFVHEEE